MSGWPRSKRCGLWRPGRSEGRPRQSPDVTNCLEEDIAL